jgi:hypothetical protein
VPIDFFCPRYLLSLDESLSHVIIPNYLPSCMRRKKKTRKPPLGKTRTQPQLTFHKLDWLEWLAIVLSVWFFIFPRPYMFLFIAMLVLPLLGVLLNGIGRPSIASLVEITKDDDGDEKYDVADFIDVPAIVLMVRVLIDFEFESYYSMIIPAIMACLLMIVLLGATHKLIDQATKSKTWIYLSLIVNICLYSVAATYGANCVFDTSDADVYHAEVVDKRISKSRKNTTYYIKVTPWGHHYDKEEIRVPYSQFNSIEPGETIAIELKEGLFGIPWYYINK